MAEQTRIEPRVLKGFRDTLPDLAGHRERMIRVLSRVFSSFGFSPIDTPALEYAEILLGKGSTETDKQLYRFTDNGGRDVALRFDLTVPLARFIAQHVNEIGTPFKRYHVAPVWRAEKPQRGRYREFIQCDFDTLGTTSTTADAEIVCMIVAALTELGISHRVRLNNRKVLNGLLASIGAEKNSVAVLRAIDKLEKIGREGVEAELQSEASLGPKESEQLFAYLSLSQQGLPNKELLDRLGGLVAGNALANTGIQELRAILSGVAAYGITESAVAVDLSIARGLDYYTGTVFETTLLDLPAIGSICSGGRYDNLASLYTSRQLPGVGGSFGLDRIIGALEELGKLDKKSSTAAVLITFLDESARDSIFRIAGYLRGKGIAAELYPEPDSLGGQLKYASRKGIPFALIAGEREISKGKFALKDLAVQSQANDLELEEVARRLAAHPAA